MSAKNKACVVGAGPNGLAAAIVLAQAGMEVEVFEAEPTAGGAVRTMELTLPGFLHDFGSAVHPLAAGSPFSLLCPCGITDLSGFIHPRRLRIRSTTAPLFFWSEIFTRRRVRLAQTAVRGSDSCSLLWIVGRNSLRRCFGPFDCFLSTRF